MAVSKGNSDWLFLLRHLPPMAMESSTQHPKTCLVLDFEDVGYGLVAGVNATYICFASFLVYHTWGCYGLKTRSSVTHPKRRKAVSLLSRLVRDARLMLAVRF